jgi:protein TonB
MEHSHIEQPKVETQRLTPPVVVDEPKNVESIVSQSTEEIHVGTKTQIGDSGVGINTIEENTRNAPVEIIDDTPMMGPEIMPEFPGGPQKMYEFIRQNMVYPPIELENRIQGKLFMTFVVDRSGNIKDVQTLRGVPGGPNLAKEALRVIRLMPQWNPGRQNGRPVSVQLNLPFVFAAY